MLDSITFNMHFDSVPMHLFPSPSTSHALISVVPTFFALIFPFPSTVATD